MSIKDSKHLQYCYPCKVCDFLWRADVCRLAGCSENVTNDSVANHQVVSEILHTLKTNVTSGYHSNAVSWWGRLSVCGIHQSLGHRRLREKYTFVLSKFCSSCCTHLKVLFTAVKMFGNMLLFIVKTMLTSLFVVRSLVSPPPPKKKQNKKPRLASLLHGIPTF